MPSVESPATATNDCIQNRTGCKKSLVILVHLVEGMEPTPSVTSDGTDSEYDQAI